MAFPPLPLPAPGQENWAAPLNESLTQLNDELSQLDDLGTSIPAAVADAETARDEAVAAAAQAEAVGTTNDTVTAGLVANPASATRGGLNGLYLVYRAWNGTSYPTRVSGAVNVFLGPTDPGLLMSGSDYWANPATTTLPAVTAAILDTSSPAFAAVQTVTRGDVVDIPLTPRNTDTVPYMATGVSGASLYGWQMGPDVISGVGGTVSIPYGWNVARVRATFVTSAAGAGDIRFSRSAATFKDDALVGAIADQVHTQVGVTVNRVKSLLLLGDIPLTNMDEVSINVQRVGTSGVDTLPVPIYILSLRLEKVS